jgi:hypothetical protein
MSDPRPLTLKDLVPVVGNRGADQPHGSTLRVLRLFEDADLLFGNSVGRYYGGFLTPGETAWLLRPQPGDPR